MVYVVAVMRDEKKQIGARVLEISKAGKRVKDLPVEFIAEVYNNSEQFRKLCVNFKVDNGKLVGTQGSIGVMPALNQLGVLVNNPRLTILYKIENIGFGVADMYGSVVNIQTERAVILANRFRLTNGEVYSDGKKYNIRPQRGTFPVVKRTNVKDLRIERKKQQANKKGYVLEKPAIEGELPTVVLYGANTAVQEELNMPAQQKLMLVNANLKKIAPYYWSMYTSIRKIPVPSSVCETMGVTEDKMIYNNTFVAELDLGSLTFIIIHEMLHIAMYHPLRSRRRGIDQSMMNIAQDLYINECICKEFDVWKDCGEKSINNGVLRVPDAGVFLSTIDETLDFNTDTPETIYHRLMKENKNGIQMPNMNQQQSGQQSGQQGQGQQGQSGQGGQQGQQGQQSGQGSGNQQGNQGQSQGQGGDQQGNQGGQSGQSGQHGQQGQGGQSGQQGQGGQQGSQGQGGQDGQQGQQNGQGSGQQNGQIGNNSGADRTFSTQVGGDNGQDQSQGNKGTNQGNTGTNTNEQNGGQSAIGNSGQDSSQGNGQQGNQGKGQGNNQGGTQNGSNSGDGSSNGNGESMGDPTQSSSSDIGSQGSDVDQGGSILDNLTRPLTDDDFKNSKIDLDLIYKGKHLRGLLNKDIMSNHSDSSATAREDSLRDTKDTLNKILVKKKMDENKSGMKLAGGPQQEIIEREIDFALAKPISWEKILDRFASKKPKKKYSMTRANRIHANNGIYLPDRLNIGDNRKLENIFICVDVSGSIGEEELHRVYTRCASIMKKYEVSAKIIFWDTAVENVGEFNDLTSLIKVKPLGGGGTDVRCVFDYISGREPFRGKKNIDKPSVLIIFTDGCIANNYEDYKRYSQRTVWVIDDENYNFTPLFGRIARSDLRGNKKE